MARRHTIVFFGNCQADALSRMLEAALPDHYALRFLSNNARTGGLQAPEVILEAIAGADVVLFQPLRAEIEFINEGAVRDAATGAIFSFPYLFNSGTGALARAFASDRYPYGWIFGQEYVYRLLEAGAGESEAIAAYREGRIDFELAARFEECVAELERREASTDIRVAARIRQRHPLAPQFLTHNHPTAELLAEICRQFKELSGLPIDMTALAGIPEPLGDEERPAVSGYDAEALGLRRSPDEDWLERGGELVSLICAAARDGFAEPEED